jgi:hypothetical protein
MLDSSKENAMFKSTAVLIFSSVVATGAIAAGPQGASTGLTRAQVRAEVLAARAAGTLDVTEANYPRELTAKAAPVVTRAQIKAEVIRARAAGELDITEATQ